MPITLNGDTGITSPAIDLTTTPLAVADGGTGLTTGENMFRNRIINGAMMIDQRNNGSAVSVTASAFPVDRTYVAANAFGVISAQRSTVAPAGFVNSIGLTVTTARSSIAAGDVYGLRQIIEGFNIADFAFGTASASPVTLSFWVRSSVTGTYSVALFNAAFNRSYIATYTVNSANTWEYKTVTIAGDTSGTWATDNSAGMTVYWDLGSGSNYNGTAGAWAGVGAVRTSGTANWISTNAATFYITGVQLEKGSTATSFDYRPYGQELALCQRYYQVFGNISGNGSIGGFNPIGQGQGVTTNSAGQYSIFLPVSMRTSPSIGISTTASAFSVTSPTDGNTACTSLPVANIGGPNMIRVAAFCTTAGFMTAGAGNILFANSSTTAWISTSAEL